MRIVIGLLAITAACGDDGNMFPVGGGGNDGGVSFPDGPPRPDAPRLVDASIDTPPALIDAALLVGRVCLLTDVRDFETCAATGAGGLTVRLGSSTTTTNADGSFTIASPGTASGLVWRITGPNIVSSFEPLADYFIPAILRTDFEQMKSGASPAVTQVDGEGSMMIFVSRNGMGVASQSVDDVSPEPFYLPFYDGTTEFAWQQTATGNFGIIWVPGIDVGTATVTVNPQVSVTGPIFDDGITFANVILP